MARKVLMSVLAIALVVTFAPAASATQSGTLVVLQDAPVLANQPNADPKPNTTGAVLFFGADLRNTKGRKIGELIGQVTTLDVKLDNVEEVDRLRELVFNMKKGQIVVLGAAQYTGTEAPNFANDNAPVTAVIVGGTGEYVGVRGVVKTKKRKDGTYRHSFTFVG